MRLLALICGGLFWLSSAAAVSRVGTGTLSNSEVGFLTVTPKKFSSYSIGGNSDVRFRGRPSLSKGLDEVPLLNVFLLENAQPEWQGRVDRQEFRTHFLNLGWRSLVHSQNCIEAFEKESVAGLTIVMSWGDGRGVLFAGDPKFPEILEGLGLMTRELHLLEGACQWR